MEEKNVFQDAKVICSCGASFETKSINKEIHVEVCSACHPFYTDGETKTSKAGRVEKFNKKYGFNKKDEGN